MADVIKISNGTTSVDLLLDSDGFSMLASGNSFGTGDKTTVYHSGFGIEGEQLVSSIEKNTSWPMKIAVGGQTNSAILENLSKIEIFAKLARRSQIYRDVPEVYLSIQLDGCTYATLYTIVDIDYSGIALLDFYNRASEQLVFDGGLSMTIVTKPYGRADYTETLKNYIVNPHMQQSITDTDLADAWNLSGTPTSYSISDTYYVCGTKSQRILCPSSGTIGIYSDVITVPSGMGPWVAYAWVCVQGDADEITASVVGDVSGELDSATLSAATLTRTGAGSYTWYRLDMSGTVYVETELTLRVERLTGDATQATIFYVDQTYLQFGVDTRLSIPVPKAWSSYHRVYPHYEMGDGESHFIDVMDANGDADALVKYTITPGTYNGIIHFGRCGALGNKIADSITFIDVADSADTAAIGDSALVKATTSSWATVLNKNEEVGDSDAVTDLYRVFIAVKDANGASSTDAQRSDFRMIFGNNIGGYSISDPVKFSVVGNVAYYYWLDMGELDVGGNQYNEEAGVGIGDGFNLQLKRDSGTDNISLAGILLLPIDDGQLLLTNTITGASVVASTLSSHGVSVYSYDVPNNNMYIAPDTMGDVPALLPKVYQRFFGVTYGSGAIPSSLVLDDSMYTEYTIEYTPRTKFLIANDPGYTQSSGVWAL